MPYSKISDKLDDLGSLDAVGFPDGSVDRYCRIEKGKGKSFDSKEELIEGLSGSDSSSFRLHTLREEPGGKSANMSIQCSKLGMDTTHYGFLDHEVFEQVDFTCRSMGSPADVTVCEFEDGSLLLAHQENELVNWSFEDMRNFERPMNEILSADVVCCANWISMHHMNRELKNLLNIDFEAEVFNFDPGSLADVDREIVLNLFETLEKLSERLEVIVHANTDEAEKLAEIYGIEGSMDEKVEGIQNKTGVTAYILHDKYRAVAGTEEGLYEVENLVTDNVETRTGAGDRFDAAVAAGRAAGWSWRESLALGNVCAVQYVETNETATQETIRQQIKEKA